MDACRDFGHTLEYWEDHLDMDLLAAMNRSRLRRPPVDLLVRDFVGYEPPFLDGEAPEFPTEEAPLYMP